MFCWNVASDVGSRKYQEDRHHVLSDAQKGIIVAAVYDGHGNARVSTALADTEIGLAPAIVAWSEKHGKFPESASEAERLFHAVDKQIWSVLEGSDKASGTFVQPGKAAQTMGSETDAKQKKSGKEERKEKKKKTKKKKKGLGSDTGGGSTAVVAVVDGHRVSFYNVGDSRALLLNADTGKVLLATKDHKPDRIDERARILSKGGDVKARHEVARATTRFTEWGYATSRAFGDFEMKRDFTEPLLQAYTDEEEEKTGGSKTQQDKSSETSATTVTSDTDKQQNLDHDGVMSVTPEVYTAVLDKDVARYYVILASDGLWDVLESDDIAALVADWTTTKRTETTGVNVSQSGERNEEKESSGKGSLAEILVDEALELGATDNITAIVLEINNNATNNLSPSGDYLRQTVCLQSMKKSIFDILAALDRTDKLLTLG